MEIIAGWSSPVARKAHNLEVVGSNPTPAIYCQFEPPPLAGINSANYWQLSRTHPYGIGAG